MLILAACFFTSALSRIANPDGALAYEVQEIAKGTGSEETVVQAEQNPDELIKMLQERQAQLDERARELAEQAKIVEAAEQRLRDQMASLAEAETRLSDLMRIAETASERDVTKLVTAYQSMGGKKAGPIFEEMDDEFAAGLLSRMDELPAAEILSALTPEKAYKITVYIAGQNARAPAE